MFLTRNLWNRRAIAGTDWSGAALTAQAGLPATRCIGWGEMALELGMADPIARPLTEIVDGFRFELTTDRLIQFQRRSTIELSDGETWSPEFGGLVVEFLLDGKPGADDAVGAEYWFPIRFAVIDPAVRLHYQGRLSDEPAEPGEVRSRPDWCVGSYAVYKAGRKLGHIPRPFARDSEGNFLWGRWAGNPAGGVLYKAFPASEMGALIPPLIVDATFGFESQGGSSTTPSTGIQRATGAYNPGASWNAETVMGYFKAASGTTGGTAGIFSDNAGTPRLAANILRDSGEITITNVAGWFQFTLDSLLPVTSQYYHLGWHHNSAQQVTYWYDTDGYQLTYEAKTYSAGTLANFASPSYVSRRVSIYAIEEEGAAVNGDCVQTIPRWWA